MNSLIIVRPSGEKFDPESMLQLLASVSNVKILMPDPIGTAYLRATFSEGSAVVLIAISRELDALWVDRVGWESIKFIWEFYRRFGGPLRVCDSAYSFDVDLSKTSSLEELGRAVHRGGRYDFVIPGKTSGGSA